MTSSVRKWWKDAVVYQIYPASFKDSNGDGIGDIPGIISKLDHIQSLGVNTIWVCPMYDSPQIDMGYDISNYEDVYPPYGTLADMETLIAECHSRNMRIILDLVVNHTSDQHQWFKDSRSSKDNPKRDWYIWRPAKYDKDGKRRPPNNWRSIFGGSAWEWEEGTQEYYLHLFCPEQPDLNWENEVTRNAIYQSAMVFWLEKGVDGFRIDVVNMYSKGQDFLDAPIVDEDAEWQEAADLYYNGPRMPEFLREINNKVLSKYDAMTVGELHHTPNIEDVLRYVSAKDPQLSMVFQFDVVFLGMGVDHKFHAPPRDWRLSQFKRNIASLQQLISGTDAWMTAFLENHDLPRSISRFGSDAPEWRTISGKMLALMLCTLSGTLFVYQGQEIGMINAPMSWDVSEYKDIEAHNFYEHVRQKTHGDEKALLAAKVGLQHLGRDHARLPMQWDASTHAGFTTANAEPWMRVHDDYRSINVKSETVDKKTLLNFWKEMLQMRKEYADIFVHGSFTLYDLQNESTFVYGKEFSGKRALVACNFTDKEQGFAQPEDSRGTLELIKSNYSVPEETTLAPWEGRVYLVK